MYLWLDVPHKMAVVNLDECSAFNPGVINVYPNMIIKPSLYSGIILHWIHSLFILCLLVLTVSVQHFVGYMMSHTSQGLRVV